MMIMLSLRRSRLIYLISMMIKSQLRQYAKNLRAEIPPQEQGAAIHNLKSNLEILLDGQNINCIGTYYPVRNEIHPPNEFYDLPLALPVIRNAETLEFYSWKQGDPLVERDFNIPIPDTRHSQLVKPDILFMPLLLCDTHGNRLGYGAGHYDRYIASRKVKPLCIGVCYDEQIYEEMLPAEPHDIRLDLIVTPKRIIDIK